MRCVIEFSLSEEKPTTVLQKLHNNANIEPIISADGYYQTVNKIKKCTGKKKKKKKRLHSDLNSHNTPLKVTHFYIVNTHDTPTVVHVLFQVFLLKETEDGRKDGVKEKTKKNVNKQTNKQKLVYFKPRKIKCRRTRYSKTSVRHLSVWMMSCSVTMFACFKSFRRETERGGKKRHVDLTIFKFCNVFFYFFFYSTQMIYLL